MSPKKTVFLIYGVAALICVAILSLVNFVILPSMEPKARNSEPFSDVGLQKAETWFPIEQDLEGIHQSGEKIQLSQLKGKVWIVAQFFAVCPHCSVRNSTELRNLYDEFKDHPDFHIVCITVDPQQDDVKKLQEYAAAVGADTKNWWFVNAGEEKETHAYLEKHLRFLGVRERSDPLQIQENGRFEHDMGMLAVGRDFKTFGKWDLAFERSKYGTPEGYERLKKNMIDRLRKELSEVQ